MSSRIRRDHDDDDNNERSEAEYRFRPRKLRRCINDALKTPLHVEGTNETETCMNDDMARVPVTTKERLLRRENIFIEMETFNNCLCDVHSLSNFCLFNLLIVQRNETVLETCLGKREFNAHLYHPTRNANYTCDMKRAGRRLACRRNDVPVPPRETRFQYVLNCLGEQLPDFSCPVTTPATPGLTTVAPITQTKVAMLVMALLISLLLGVLGTWLGIFCWRRRRNKKRRTNRPLPPLMPRPEHSSLPNLYDEDYTEENIYDVVKAVDESPTSHPVPDLLSRVPSLPPVTPRPPLDLKDKRNSNQSEFYEPLLRGHSTSQISDHTSPKIPVSTEAEGEDYLPLLPDRNSKEISETETVKRFHPYDTPDESIIETEADDASMTVPKVVDDLDNENTKTKPEYYILEPPGGKTRGASLNQEQSTPVTKEGLTPDTNKETSQKITQEEDAAAKVPETDIDSDGYEIPVSEEVPAFDIASSFRKLPKSEIVQDKDDVLDV